MSVVKEIEVNKIEDFEQYLAYLENNVWDYISIARVGKDRLLDFRSRVDGDEKCFRFIFRGRGVVDRVRILCSKYVTILDGFLTFKEMSVVIDIEKFKNGVSDIDVNIVRVRDEWWL
jgi:hypothetical protein